MPRLLIPPTSLSKPTLLALSAAAVALAVTGCGSSGRAGAGAGGSAAASSQPGTSFHTAAVSGLGTVLVDARGMTVYILTSGGQKNVPCTDSTGCTKVWPSLPLPSGVAAAKAGPGLQASLLGTTKLGDGRTYPTYNGWLMYEYAADPGPGQAGGQGIQSFGGTWYALSPTGTPITSAPGTPTSSRSGGYGY